MKKRIYRKTRHEEIWRYFNTEKAYAESKKAKKRYIPDMSHPWKKDNFMKHVYAMVRARNRLGVLTNK